jgi:hypothetical protein
MMMSPGTNYVPIEVLLVEDSPGDVRLTVEAFKTAKMTSICGWSTTVRKPWST